MRATIDAMIERHEIKSDAALAKKAGIVRATLNEALLPDSVQSTVMPQINKALGWPTPVVLSTPDDLEIWAMFDGLDDFELGKALERAREARERLRNRPVQRRRGSKD